MERIEEFLGLRIDPTDLHTCAFGEYNFKLGAMYDAQATMSAVQLDLMYWLE